MSTDRVTVRITRAGALAAEFASAERSLIRAEHDIEALLDSLFGGRWRDFEVGAEDLAIDVYGVVPSPAATDALRRAGFVVVTLHDHASTQFLHCACRSSERQ